MRTRGPRRAGVHYLQGLLMGTADTIPGISGGTVALLVGIYERLVRSIWEIAHLPAALVRGGGEELRRAARRVEWWLILPLLTGIASAIALGAVVIPLLLDAYPSQTSGLFFGLILGSIPVPWRGIERPGRREVLVAVVAAIAAFVLVGLPPREIADPGLPFVFAAAAVAICAMILPGISGAFILLVLGVYAATLDALRHFDVIYVLVFVAGAATGLALFSRLLVWLLAHRHDLTMAALVGLMAGSLRALWPWIDEDRGVETPPADLSTLVVVILAIAGFVTVAALTGFGRRARSLGGGESVHTTREAPRLGGRRGRPGSGVVSRRRRGRFG